MRVRVTGGVSDLARDLDQLARRSHRELNGVVRDAAKKGNRLAREFASEDHTMFSDVDVDYPKAFTVEQVGPLAYEYGPDASLPQGSKASGYEHGSINQATPHQNLDRSVDIIRVEFPMDVSDKLRDEWARAGFR